MNYYDIKITGKDVKRFIMNLYKRNINFYNIKHLDNSVIIKVNKADYLKIMAIKTIYDIEVIKYYGIVRLKNFFFKYLTFIIILIVGFFLLLGLTNTIFDVTVNSNNLELNNLVLDELKKYGISKYKPVISFNKKEKIKEKILNKYNDKIEWLEIKRIGTKYIVELEERKINNKKIDYTPRDIIAKKNGIITSINASNGEVIGKINHYVKKGDIIISGNIHKGEDIKATVRADGIVYAETWYTVKVELPYHYEEKKKTGRKQKVLNINYLNKHKKLSFKKFKSFNNNKIFSIKNFLLPINLSFDQEEETVITDNVYTEENAFFKASSIARSKLKENLGDNIQIIFEKKLKTNEINSKIEVVIFYKVIENITDYRNIDSDMEIR